MTDYDNSNNPAPAFARADGITESERYLKKLCDHTFLSLWSYPNVFRNQRSSAKGDGKELCDLLVVFENHVVIFSDKDCAFPDSGDLRKDWNRWSRKAVGKSADQVWGAERWINSYPDHLFLDRACKHKFPIDLPDPNEAVFHRVVVAHDSSNRCRQTFGGSGSLILDPSVVGVAHYTADQDTIKPFRIGDINPDKGYVHVLDDTTLAIVLETLDTISDFIEYLTKKEAFMRSGRLGMAAGEEELLAMYLSDIDEQQEHDFIVPTNVTKVFIDEGRWEDFKRSPQRRAQLEANKVSYAWDALIEQFGRHIIGGTQYYRSHEGVNNSERTIRLLAREPRTRRRALATALFELLDEDIPDGGRRTRVLFSPRSDDPYYVLMLLPRPEGMPYEAYRTMRRNMLEACCRVLKAMRPKAQDIVGIAMEQGSSVDRSEDTVYLNARIWSEEDQAKALDLQKYLDLLQDVSGYAIQVQEYPDPPNRILDSQSSQAPEMKGRHRNNP